MSKEKRVEAARKGGRAVQKKGTAHRFKKGDEARSAQVLATRARKRKKEDEDDG